MAIRRAHRRTQSRNHTFWDSDRPRVKEADGRVRCMPLEVEARRDDVGIPDEARNQRSSEVIRGHQRSRHVETTWVYRRPLARSAAASTSRLADTSRSTIRLCP